MKERKLEEMMTDGTYWTTPIEKELDERKKKGEHYRASVEVIKMMEELFGISSTMDFCILNAYKYISRCKYKHNIKEDLFKAENYLHYYRTGEWIKEEEK